MTRRLGTDLEQIPHKPLRRSGRATQLLTGFWIAFCVLGGVILGAFSDDASPVGVLWRPLLFAAAFGALLSPVALISGGAGAVTVAMLSILFVSWSPILLLAAAAVGVLMVVASMRRREFDLSKPLLAAVSIFALVGLFQAVSVGGVYRNSGIPIDAEYNRGVYFILLDGYPRADTLHQLDIDIEQFLVATERMGFNYYPQAQSTFGYTYRTLSSMFGIEPSSDGWGTVEDRRAARQNWVLPDGFVSISTFLGHTTVPGVAELAARGLNGFETGLIARTPVASSEVVQRMMVKALRRGVEDVLTTLAQTEHRHVFAHVMAPHGPFLYSASDDVPLLAPCWPNCNPFDHDINRLGISMEDWREGMSAYLAYLNERVLDVLGEIVERDPDALVIVLSDHGGRYSEASPQEWFHSFLLARTPNSPNAFGSAPTPDRVVDIALDLARGRPRD